MHVAAKVALIDIEGTVGSISFVRDVLFPYAAQRMDAYVADHRDDSAVQSVLADTAREAKLDPNDEHSILQQLHRWSDDDVKIAPLKTLQGLVWKQGFESGQLRGHLYDDAADALRRYYDAGVRLAVYSSGSVQAQELLFGHSVAGNLLPIFDGFFDTTTGGKKDASSYVRIARELNVAPGDVVFFSDNESELDAAQAAGLHAVQLARTQDNTVASTRHTSVPDFREIDIAVQ